MGTAMKLAHTTLALFIAVLALPMAAVAQEEEAIDDIIVTGQKSTTALRRDLFRAEDDFYSLYNKLNDDNDYDVRCFYEMPTGLRVKQHVCRPVFFSKARNREDLNRRISPDTDPVIADKMVKLQEKLETLVAANPELQVAMANYNTARAHLMAASDERANN
ncbi:MAG: hypothetical protein GWP64_05700 [Gammaproteobacteria bacterium]|nr:hypothetical protein [Gammaproteobacteria bacterium]NCF59328.1 hypothetical protein [Gammaproteobacteria bacterium]